MADHQDGIGRDLAPETLQNMGLFLLGQVMGNDEGGFEICFTGAFYHMRVMNSGGTVVAHVVGKDSGELADQLALAIFHDIPEERLCILHRRPLNKPARLQNEKEPAPPPAKKRGRMKDEPQGIVADDQDKDGAEFMSAVFHNLGLYLLRLRLGDQDFQIQQCISGDTLHLRIKLPGGNVPYQVSGQDPVELGDQLALACFHDLTIEGLRQLHHEQLKKPLQLQKGVLLDSLSNNCNNGMP